MTNTTKLEAVNQMLGTVQDAPVDSLSSGYFQADNALRILNMVSKEVQASDWDFNREDRVTFTPNTDGEIVLPDNTLRATPTYAEMDVQRRGNRLYDLKNHTFIFTKSVLLNCVWMFTFEELPEEAGLYITAKAARRFAWQALGSDTIDQQAGQVEREALIRLENYDSETAKFNLFSTDAESAYIVDRD